MASLKENKIEFTNWSISENDGLDTIDIIKGVDIKTTFDNNGIKYDNSASGLDSVDIKSAIDETTSNASINAISSGFSYFYRYNNNLSINPGSGNFLFNNLDLSLVTEFSVSDTQTLQNVNVSNLINLRINE